MEMKILKKALTVNRLYLIGIIGHIIFTTCIMLVMTGVLSFKIFTIFGPISGMISLLVIVGLIIIYIARRKVDMTFLQTYYQYMIRSFWITWLYNTILNIVFGLFIPMRISTDPEHIHSIDLGNACVIIILTGFVSIFFMMRTLKARQYLYLEQSIPNHKTWWV